MDLWKLNDSCDLQVNACVSYLLEIQLSLERYIATVFATHLQLLQIALKIYKWSVICRTPNYVFDILGMSKIS